MRAWIDVNGKVMVTDAAKVVVTDTDLAVPIAPHEPLEITDDPWATVADIQYAQYVEETLDGQRQMFSQWGQRPGDPNTTVDITRQTAAWHPDAGAAEIDKKEAGSWMLWRSGAFGDWWGYKARGTGPEGTYARLYTLGDPDPDPATLTVARA